MKVVLRLEYANGFSCVRRGVECRAFFHVLFVFTAIAFQGELYSSILKYFVEML